MPNKKLPFGAEFFEEIRERDLYYIDKTLLIRDILDKGGKVNLFARPRGFGKTLNLTMLKSFFEIGTDTSQFDALAIAKEDELCREHMGKYPVVFISLRDIDGTSFDEAYETLRSLIRAEALRLQYLLESEKISDYEKRAFLRILTEQDERSDIIASLATMTSLLEKHHRKRVVLLIDDYDAPLETAYHRGYYDETANLLRGVFARALKTNDSLHFAVMTGCLRMSNSKNNRRFDEYFGFTTGEVESLLNDYGLSEYLESIRDWYDGYRFADADVYCPSDVINYCHDLSASRNAKPKACRMDACGGGMVRRLVEKSNTGTSKMEIERLVAGQSIFKQVDETLTYDEAYSSIDNMFSLLFMKGYLTLASEPEGDMCELVIPNRQVRTIFIKHIKRLLFDRARAETDVLMGLYRSFESGDANTIQEVLNAQLATAIIYYDAGEPFYRLFLLAFLKNNANWWVSSNQETGKGRSDILVERVDGRLGFVVEVKDVRKPGRANISEKLDAFCQAAIKQIEDKDYASSLRRYRVKDIWLYGIAFYDRECRVVARGLHKLVN